MKKPKTRQDYLTAPIPIRRQLLRFLRRDDPHVIFDIGACEGEDTVRYCRLFPHARLFSAEPVPDNLARIQQLIADEQLEARVTVLDCALSHSTGEATLHLSSGAPPGKDEKDWDFGNKSSSLYQPASSLSEHPWLRFDSTVTVSTRRLEDVAREHGVQRIDFIHMDVQGAELDVLRGAGPLLQSTRLIWLEVEAVELYAGQPLKTEVEQFMGEAGFLKVLDTVGATDGDQLWRHRDTLALSWWRRWL